MKQLKRIAGKIKKDRVRTEPRRIEHNINNRKINLVRHIVRMNPNRLVRSLTYAERYGRRKRGRPSLRTDRRDWKENPYNRWNIAGDRNGNEGMGEQRII